LRYGAASAVAFALHQAALCKRSMAYLPMHLRNHFA
jgi:hypothetical protein